MDERDYSHFRYFVLCRDVQGIASGATTLVDVLDTLHIDPAAFPAQVQLRAVVGIAALPNVDLSLDFLPFRLSDEGQMQKVPGSPQFSAVLERPRDMCSADFRWTMRLPEPGVYGVLLGDPGGSFGPSRRVLAEYRFRVNGEGKSHENN